MLKTKSSKISSENLFVGSKSIRKTGIMLFALFVVIAAVTYVWQQHSQQPAAGVHCKESDWNCICARISDAETCERYFDCDWTDFHSNEYYCMERFCMTYNETECKAHERCAWAFNKLGQAWQCEGVEFIDERFDQNKTSG